VDLIRIDSLFFSNLIVALSLAILFTFLDAFFDDRLMRLSSTRFFLLIPSFLYFLLGFLLLTFASLSPDDIRNVHSLKDLKTLIPPFDVHFGRFLLFFYLACFFNNFIRRTRKKIGKGNFKNWIFGMMNKPTEDERIFMFIDMKSSTRIAEKLSHEKFSHLVQDVFNDMAVVDNYAGEIYQYVGDGAIISWPVEKGLKNNNFLRAYFGFTNLIEQRNQYYQRKYDLVPTFKAGIHVGKVMVLQVGRIRRDISYNGDTLNTAARIESTCNEYNKGLLVSGDLISRMIDRDDFHIKEVGNLRLKGKRKLVDIFHVSDKRILAPQTPPFLRLLIDKLSFYKRQMLLSKKA
jgi:adenylate cyclase